MTAKLVSYLFHPLLFTTYLVLLLGLLMPRFLLIPPSALWKFAAFVFVITFAFPVANIFMLKVFGSISSIEMRDREERIIPFSMITIFYGVVVFMFFYKIGNNVNFNKMMLIVAVMTMVATGATFFFKISVHSLAISGAAGILLPLNKVAGDGSLLWPTAILFGLAGVVMSSRLYLQTHTRGEVLYGAAAGFLVGFGGMFLLF